MNQYKRIDTFVGWGVFLIASITYLLTIEPTTSLWDCGEFIATAVKLEVGHPPGAPLWMILGRIASLFAGGDVTMQAYYMNAAAGLASGFTILFLFWSITHIAKRIIEKLYYSNKNQVKDYESLSLAHIIAIELSGVVGALIYTFSDTFWFSAVEAEVYSLSSLFTAVVFWCILKWEEESEQKHSLRWIILISYLMGLSIGVHLLNLLAIPAIVLVVYFKKYTFKAGTFILALLLSCIILGVLLYFVIPGTVSIMAYVELMCVNTFSLPYNSGLILFCVLLLGLCTYLIIYSHQKNKAILNLIMVSFTVMMIGYGSFAMTVIRSNADTPINENEPSTAFNLLSYLNRDQYGSRPLVYGNYYTAQVVSQETLYTYAAVDGKYVKIAKTNPEYKYDDQNQTFFPRMYSNSASHIQAYKQWAGIQGDQKPTFAQNLKFFFTYQLGHMYFRYFMWNFSGRQNDTQSHGSYINGNWITGIGFIDSLFLGNQSDMPDSMKNDESRNAYYLLPLLLGFLGIFYTINNDFKNCIVIFTFFLLTGIAIVVYLNQTPYQPRERDYAYAGSFYAFSIWCGLGVLSIFKALEEKAKLNSMTAALISAVCIFVPIQMGAENWRDHDRSNRYTARDLAFDYLNSCAPNAILFTFGDNDTFPLWYAQEVEGVRTDVRVVNLSLLGTDWYIRQMNKDCYDGKAVPFTMDYKKYAQDRRNVTLVTDRSGMFVDNKYNTYKQEFAPKYSSLYSQFIDICTKSGFASNFKTDFDKVNVGIDKLGIQAFASIVNTLASNQNIDKIFGSFTSQLKQLKDETLNLLGQINQKPLDIRTAIEFCASDNKENQVQLSDGDYVNYMPSKVLSIPTKDGSAIEFTLSKRYLMKNDLAILDILSKNNWERPIYFACSGSQDDYLGLQDYFSQEGFAFRLVPYKTKRVIDDGEFGDVNADVMYDNMMNKFVWGNINGKDCFLDANHRRQIDIIGIRSTFVRLANKLIELKDNQRAEKVLDKCMELLPDYAMPFDYYMIGICQGYYLIGQADKADKIALETCQKYMEQYQYLTKLQFEDNIVESRQMQICQAIIAQLYRLAQDHNSARIDDFMKCYSILQ